MKIIFTEWAYINHKYMAWYMEWSKLNYDTQKALHKYFGKFVDISDPCDI